MTWMASDVKFFSALCGQAYHCCAAAKAQSGDAKVARLQNHTGHRTVLFEGIDELLHNSRNVASAPPRYARPQRAQRLRGFPRGRSAACGWRLWLRVGARHERLPFHPRILEVHLQERRALGEAERNHPEAVEAEARALEAHRLQVRPEDEKLQRLHGLGASRAPDPDLRERERQGNR